MSKVCQLTGKSKSTGHNVSHSNRHTKRTFEPNVQKKTIIDPATGTKLKLKLSTRAQRTLMKNPGKFKNELATLVKKQNKKNGK
ncbi:50S ribosomal protein L28 [Candidatus Peregrinibacteria bacterium]|nr:50S ribosomal protein L28 [Candidatus Peregrinibacteria bacterium]